MSKQGVVNIRGKQYKTVVLRVNEFRETHTIEDGWSIQTWLISDDGDRVVTRTIICDKDDHIIATGLAEEVRGSSNINKTSALENCETSSIGRCLSAAGYAGEEYCSADELVNALAQQEQPQPKSNPAPKEAPPEPKKDKNYVQGRAIHYLELLEELVGESTAQDVKAEVMGRSDFSKGCSDLGTAFKRGTVTECWNLKNAIKAEVQRIAKEGNKEE